MEDWCYILAHISKVSIILGLRLGFLIYLLSTATPIAQMAFSQERY